MTNETPYSKRKKTESSSYYYGNTPPLRTDVPWIDISNGQPVLRYYDFSTSSWKPIGMNINIPEVAVGDTQPLDGQVLWLKN